MESENIIVGKDVYIDSIMGKFKDNSLLLSELRVILELFDDQYLKQLNVILSKYDLKKLNSVDNALDIELQGIIDNNDSYPENEVKETFRKLREQMIKLQLNILLSYCVNDDKKVLIPLVIAINNKIESVNNIINPKNEEIKIEIEEIKKEEIVENPLTPVIPDNIEKIYDENSIKKLKDTSKLARKIQRTYPRLTNNSNNEYLEYVKGIIDPLIKLNEQGINVEKFINFINDYKLLDFYKKLILTQHQKLH